MLICYFTKVFILILACLACKFDRARFDDARAGELCASNAGRGKSRFLKVLVAAAGGPASRETFYDHPWLGCDRLF